LAGINPASTEGTEVCGLVLQAWGFSPSDHSHTCISDWHEVARALQEWFIPSLVFVLRWKHFETQLGESAILKENTEVPVKCSGAHVGS